LRRDDLQAATTPSSTRLADFLDDWLASQKTRLRETTWHSYDHAIKRVHHHLGQVALQSLTTLQIERFYAALVESGGKRRTGLAPKSVRNTHVVLRKALADAERLGLVSRNVASSARAPTAVVRVARVWYLFDTRQ
jgi:site-specific recombinase XerC